MIRTEFETIASHVLAEHLGADSVRVIGVDPTPDGPSVRWVGPRLATQRERRPLAGGGHSLGPPAGGVILGVLVRTLQTRWAQGSPYCPLDWSARIARRHERIFGRTGPETGPGWAWLWEGAAREIADIGIPRNFRATETKEKFGGIRWYYEADEDCQKVDDIVDAVQCLSAFICEDCGRPGSVRGGSWLRCQCDLHAAARKRESG